MGIRPGQSKGPYVGPSGSGGSAASGWLAPVISLYDPTSGTPLLPNIGDRYISTVTANGWTINNVYQWNGSVWNETTPINGDVVFVTDLQQLYGFIAGSWVPIPQSWLEPVISIFDNTAALPVAPSDGDRYIALVTANGWTKDYIYEYNSLNWEDTVPITGSFVYNEDTSLPYLYSGAAWVQFAPLTAHDIGGALHNASSVSDIKSKVSGPDFLITSMTDEISALTAKSVPTLSDQLMIEDVADSNSKKRSTVGEILSASPDIGKVMTSATDPAIGYLVAKLEAGIAMNVTEDVSNPLDPKAKLDVVLGTLSDQAAAGDDTRFRKVSITASDTSSGFLNNKMLAGPGITLSTVAPGGGEGLQVEAWFGTQTNQCAVGNDTRFTKVKVSSTDTDQNYLNDKIETAGLISITATGLTQTIQDYAGNEKLLLSINAVNPTIDLDVMLNAPRVAPKSLGLNEISNTYIDGTPGDASMRTLGTLSNQAAAGDDSRFTKVKTSATDTTPDYIHYKVLPGTNISVTKENPSGNEDLRLAVTGQGAANGLATLGPDSKLTSGQLPEISIVDYLGVVASQGDMLNLVGQQGDWCTRSDLGTNWIITGNTPPVLITDWTTLSYPPSDHKLLVSGTDSTIDYLINKLKQGTAISITEDTSTATDHKAAIGVNLGTLSDQACAGNDSRLSNDRNPTHHASTHNVGGDDTLAVDAAAATGSLRSLGTLSSQACAGNDSRLSDSRTPVAHDIGGALHNAGTIATVNSKLTDGSLLTTLAAEFLTLPEKTVPVLTDLMVIEDIEDYYRKKKVSFGNIPLDNNIVYWKKPIISIYDNTAAIPVAPTVGDRYIAQVTANGWTANHIYEYTSVNNTGPIPAPVPPPAGTTYWVDCSQIGTGAGTLVSPFNYAQFITHCNSNTGMTYRLRYELDRGAVAIGINGATNTIEAWDLAVYGPWRLKTSVASSIICAHLSGGIVYNSGSSITITCPDVYNMFLRTYASLNINAASVFKGCTLIGESAGTFNVVNVSLYDCVVVTTFSYTTYTGSCYAYNCVSNRASNITFAGFAGLTYCQYNWTPPTWPAWNDAKALYYKSALNYSSINSGVGQPRPGNGTPLYTGYNSDLFGNTRDDIGAYSMEIAPTLYWTDTTPLQGMEAYNKTDDMLYSYNGSTWGLNKLWLYGTGAPPSPTGLRDGTLYFKYTP
jgi:hypothetical protein